MVVVEIVGCLIGESSRFVSGVGERDPSANIITVGFRSFSVAKQSILNLKLKTVFILKLKFLKYLKTKFLAQDLSPRTSKTADES